MSTLNYRISIADPFSHYFEIALTYTPSTADLDELYLPNWIPGSYMIRDFAKHILDLEARDKNGPLTIEIIDKCRFSVAHHKEPVTVSYKVYAFDLSVRKAYLDQQFGFLNTTSGCFVVAGHENEQCFIELVQPSHPTTHKWRPATGLLKIKNTAEFDWGYYQADNYLALTDYPILFGDLDIEAFTVADIPHYMVTVGRHFGSLKSVVKDLKPLCEYHFNIFGAFPEVVDQYLFLTMLTDEGFGGLEHLNSTALLASRMDIVGEEDAITDEYQTFLSLCSHEYLHTWNVKQLKPVEFVPYQLDREIYTKQLWFYEGVTSYLDDFSLVETSTISHDKYFETLSKTLTRVQRGKGQYRQSVTESSYLAWTKFYQQDHTAPDQVVSYYQKGALIACFADLAIRSQSNNSLSLKDVMRTAWERFGIDAIGTKQEDLEALFHNFMSEEDYQSFHSFLYERSVIDLSEVFNRFGVKLSYQSQTKQNQWFMPNSDNSQDPQESYWLGATLANVNGQVLVRQVLEGTPAARSGLAVGDQLVAFNQIKISNENFENLLNRAGKTRGNLLHYFRKDSLLCAELALETSPAFVASLAVTDKNKLSHWLG